MTQLEIAVLFVQGLLSNPEITNDRKDYRSYEEIAIWALKQANALIAQHELNQQNNQKGK